MVNWYGRVVDVTSTYLEVICNDVKYTLEPTSDLDYAVFSLGEDLLFTGVLHRAYALDHPEAPGFYIKSHIITDYDKATMYLNAEKYVYRVRGVDSSRLSGSEVIAECTVQYITTKENVVRQISGIAYRLLVDKYPDASSMSLTVNLKSINKYGEDQKRSLGVCEMNSKDVRNLRRYTSEAMYNYSEDSALDCVEVTMQLFY